MRGLKFSRSCRSALRLVFEGELEADGGLWDGLCSSLLLLILNP